MSLRGTSDNVITMVVYELFMLGNWVLCGMGLSLCSHLSLYPIMLILPLTVMACNNKVLYNNCYYSNCKL